MRNQAVFGCGRGILSLNTLFGEEVSKLGGVPVVVWCSDLGLPVVLDEDLEVFAVGRCRVGNVVIRQPSLKLGFMPFVVD